MNESKEKKTSTAGQQPQKKRKKSKAAKTTAKTVAAVVAVLLVTGFFITAWVLGSKISTSETVFPNVYVEEIALGGLTKEQAEQTLRERGWDERVSGTLTVKLPRGISTKLDYVKAGASLTSDLAAEAAYAFGHGDGPLESLIAYLRAMSATKDVSDTPTTLDESYIRGRLESAIKRFDRAMEDKGYTLDQKSGIMTFLKGAGEVSISYEALYQQAAGALKEHEREVTVELPELKVTMPDFQGMYESMSAQPADAYYDPETDTVVPEVIGADFDVQAAIKTFNDTPLCEYFDIPVAFTLPNMTYDELSELIFRDKLGSCTTYAGGGPNRVNNIDLVAHKLNGLVMMPGDSFSYNGYVGERTEEAGFKPAPAYGDGKVIQEIGGGICQVSSTLYNAVLCANLQVDTRTCHYFPVDYLPYGLDATVSWPNPDFGFTNNRDFPIRLVAYVESGKLTIEIWGSNIDGTHVEPRSVRWEIYDPNYPTVQIGWGASSWRYIFDADGNEIDRIWEAGSTYYLHDEDIHYPEPSPEPGGDEEPIVIP